MGTIRRSSIIILALLVYGFARAQDGVIAASVVTTGGPTPDTTSLAKFQFGPTGATAVTGYAQILGDPYSAVRTATQNSITVSAIGTTAGWGNGLGITSYAGGKTTGNNSGVRPDNILKNFIFSYENGATITTKNVEISGLTAGATYILKMGGSRTSSGTPDTQLGDMAYTIDGTEHLLDVTDNTTRGVTVSATADSSGKIDIGVHKMGTPSDTQTTGYIGWLEILQAN
jgi:hypothetical protein